MTFSVVAELVPAGPMPFGARNLMADSHMGVLLRPAGDHINGTRLRRVGDVK